MRLKIKAAETSKNPATPAASPSLQSAPMLDRAEADCAPGSSAALPHKPPAAGSLADKTRNAKRSCSTTAFLATTCGIGSLAVLRGPLVLRRAR
jgi:hypothetical protein